MPRAAPLLLSLAVLVPLGFYLKLAYRGPFAPWVHDSFGGALYVIFWCLVVALVLPRTAPSRIAVGVLAATCAVEFSQRWHPPFLEWLRSFLIGRTILGSFFDWSDFPYYFLGAALGWLWLRATSRAL
jgi:hypothetical protein